MESAVLSIKLRTYDGVGGVRHPHFLRILNHLATFLLRLIATFSLQPLINEIFSITHTTPRGGKFLVVLELEGVEPSSTEVLFGFLSVSKPFSAPCGG